MEIIRAKGKLIPGITQPLWEEKIKKKYKKGSWASVCAACGSPKDRLKLCLGQRWPSSLPGLQPWSRSPLSPQLHIWDGRSNRTDGQLVQAGTQPHPLSSTHGAPGWEGAGCPHPSTTEQLPGCRSLQRVLRGLSWTSSNCLGYSHPCGGSPGVLDLEFQVPRNVSEGAQHFTLFVFRKAPLSCSITKTPTSFSQKDARPDEHYIRKPGGLWGWCV